MNSFEERILIIVTDYSGGETVTKDSTFEELEMDSLDLFEVACEIEEQCGVKIDDTKLEELKTVGKLIEYVESVK
jgi:acyl carrier protein